MYDSTRQTQPIPNFQNLVLQSSRFSLHVLPLSTTLVDEIFRYEKTLKPRSFWGVNLCVTVWPRTLGKESWTWQNSLGRFKEWEQFLLFLSTRIKVLLVFFLVCFLYCLFVSKLWMFLNWKHKKWRLVQGKDHFPPQGEHVDMKRGEHFTNFWCLETHCIPYTSQ